MSDRQGFSVYVGNIPYDSNEDELGRFFGGCGQLIGVRIVYDRATNRPKGFGFCQFAEQSGAEAAISKLDGAEFKGRVLRVSWANK